MKIICSCCGKLLGEKEPFKDVSVSQANCTDCLEKQKQVQKPMHKYSNEQPKESDAEIAANVYQVISALADGALMFAVKRGILDKDFQLLNSEELKKAT